jgi:hypothetical protein
VTSEPVLLVWAKYGLALQYMKMKTEIAVQAFMNSRNRLSPRYILYSNHTNDTRVRNQKKKNAGATAKHAQEKRNEDNGETTKR